VPCFRDARQACKATGHGAGSRYLLPRTYCHAHLRAAILLSQHLPSLRNSYTKHSPLSIVRYNMRDKTRRLGRNAAILHWRRHATTHAHLRLPLHAALPARHPASHHLLSRACISPTLSPAALCHTACTYHSLPAATHRTFHLTYLRLHTTTSLKGGLEAGGRAEAKGIHELHWTLTADMY